MKSIHRIYLLISILAFLLISSCSKKMYSPPISSVQSLGGFVMMKSDVNKNHKIKVKLLLVEEIEKFLANEKTYNVWMLTKDNYPIKIGHFQMENKNKTETYKALAERPKKIFISEEVLENVVGPGVTLLTINY
jgi:anti-sigma-K factor RskA